MYLLGKTKLFRDSFFKMDCLPVYSTPNSKSQWFLTDNEKQHDRSKHLTVYNPESLDYSLNSHGFRSIEFEHDPSAINILVFGESNTFGLGLPFNDIWFNQLDNLLKEDGIKKTIKIFNMAAPGYSLDIVATLLNQSLNILKPDYVIIMGPSFFASTLYVSEDLSHSHSFVTVGQHALWHKTDPAFHLDLDFVPNEMHKYKSHFDLNLNLAQSFFSSLQTYFYIRRLAGENLLIWFKNPRMYKIELNKELEFYDRDFYKYFLDFDKPVFAPGTIEGQGFARDGIHLGAKHHEYIAHYIFDRLLSEGTIEKWKQ